MLAAPKKRPAFFRWKYRRHILIGVSHPEGDDGVRSGRPPGRRPGAVGLEAVRTPAAAVPPVVLRWQRGLRDHRTDGTHSGAIKTSARRRVLPLPCPHTLFHTPHRAICTHPYAPACTRASSHPHTPIRMPRGKALAHRVGGRPVEEEEVGAEEGGAQGGDRVDPRHPRSTETTRTPRRVGGGGIVVVPSLPSPTEDAGSLGWGVAAEAKSGPASASIIVPFHPVGSPGWATRRCPASPGTSGVGTPERDRKTRMRVQETPWSSTERGVGEPQNVTMRRSPSFAAQTGPFVYLEKFQKNNTNVL